MSVPSWWGAQKSLQSCWLPGQGSNLRPSDDRHAARPEVSSGVPNEPLTALNPFRHVLEFPGESRQTRQRDGQQAVRSLSVMLRGLYRFALFI